MTKRGMNKGAISDIVSTVLIIMIAVAAVGIIGAIVVPMLRNSLSGVDVSMVDVTIDSTAGYTGYDSSLNLLSVMVRKGANEIEVPKVDINVIVDGNSQTYTRDFGLAPGSSKVYYILLDKEPESIELVPVVASGSGEKRLSVVSRVGGGAGAVGGVILSGKMESVSFGETLPFNGLVAYWNADGNANDVSGNGINGVLINSTRADASGICGNAFVFNGKNDSYVEFGDIQAFKIMNKTISLWAKPNNITGNDLLFSAGTANYYVSFTSNNKAYAAFYNSTGVSSGASGSNEEVEIGSWHSYVWVFDVVGTGPTDKVNISFYKDGAYDKSVVSSQGYNNTIYGDNFILGNLKFSARYPFNGSLDEVMIWSRVLSGQEITELYESQKSCSVS